MKLIVHAGTHKTGTTSFQNLCSENFDTLVSNKLLYPKYKTWAQHSYLAWHFQSMNAQAILQFFKHASDTSKRLGCTTTLLSGEDFENFLVDQELAKTFEQAARSVGYTEIEWVVVRRQAGRYLRSIYAEMAKHNIVLDIEVIANLILKFGYFSCGTKYYNYMFVFDADKFVDIFAGNVNTNISLIDMKDFIQDYAGRCIIDPYLTESAHEVLKASGASFGTKNASPRLEDVETRYALNYLGLQRQDQNLDADTADLIKALVSIRSTRSKELLETFDKRFLKVFG